MITAATYRRYKLSIKTHSCSLASSPQRHSRTQRLRCSPACCDLLHHTPSNVSMGSGSACQVRVQFLLVTLWLWLLHRQHQQHPGCSCMWLYRCFACQETDSQQCIERRLFIRYSAADDWTTGPKLVEKQQTTATAACMLACKQHTDHALAGVKLSFGRRMAALVLEHQRV
jgi:hypothetical protein